MQPIINALLDPVVNFGKVTVSGGYPAGIDNIAATLIVGDGSKLPNPADPAGSFNLVWFDSSTYSDPADDPKVEIVRCIANVNDTLTLMRAQEGTSASTKNTSGKIYKMILAPTRKTIDDIGVESQSKVNTHSALSTGVHGVTSNIVGVSDTQTLANKTLTSPFISTIYGGSAANDGITIEGTSNEIKTSSYVTLQPTSGNVGIGATPTAKLHVGGTPGVDGIKFPDGTLQTTAASSSTLASKTQIARNISGDVRMESSPSIYSGTAEESTGSQTPVEMTLLATSFTKTGLRTFIQFSLEQMRTYYPGGYTCSTYLQFSDGTTTLNSSVLYSNWYPFTVWTASIDLFTLNNTTIAVKVFTGGSVGYGSAVRNLKLYAPLTDTIN